MYLFISPSVNPSIFPYPIPTDTIYYLYDITMSFHLTAESLRLEENHILIAQLRNADGEFVDSSIDLNTIIGNVDGMPPAHSTVHWAREDWKLTVAGRLEWDGQNFSESAEEVQFGIESENDVPILRALLKKADEEWAAADVNLSERIVNENGAFVFV